MTTMRAKLAVGFVHVNKNNEGEVTSELVRFHGVPKTIYDSTGADEDNTFAKYSPSAELSIYIANPELFGKFAAGDKFYVDFAKAEK